MQRIREMAFVGSNVGWQCGVLLFLILTNQFLPDLYVVLSFLGFIVLVEVSAPTAVRPSWRNHLKWIGVLSLLLSVLAVAYRFRLILS